MKKKWTIVALGLAFVALLGGASVLYNKLSDTVERDMLVSSATKADVDRETETTVESVPIDGKTGVSGSATSESGQTTAEEETTEAEKVPAPDFTVIDAEGNEVKLSDMVGKPVVVNFWASWCGPCKMEMPEFEEIYKELGDEVHFMMVNLTDGWQETKEKAENFIEEQGYTFPVYYDTMSEGAMNYGVSSIPATYFIDAEGNAIAQARGAIDGETVKIGIDMTKE